MPQTKVRVVGSGFTTLNFDGRPIAYLDSFRDSGQTALGGQGGWEAITPLGARHPVEIATSRVLTAGTLTASIRELWNEPVWYQLMPRLRQNRARTIVDVWEELAKRAESVTCQVIIKTPGRQSNRRKVFHGCVITAIDDGEDVTIGTLSVAKNVTIAYTHTTGGDGHA